MEQEQKESTLDALVVELAQAEVAKEAAEEAYKARKARTETIIERWLSPLDTERKVAATEVCRLREEIIKAGLADDSKESHPALTRESKKVFDYTESEAFRWCCQFNPALLNFHKAGFESYLVWVMNSKRRKVKHLGAETLLDMPVKVKTVDTIKIAEDLSPYLPKEPVEADVGS